MATNESMNDGKFYYGSSSASPWVNDLMHKKNVDRELKMLKIKNAKKAKPPHMQSAVLHAIKAKQKMHRAPQRHIEEKVTLVKLERTLNQEQTRGARLNEQLNKLLRYLAKKKLEPPKPRVKVYRSARPWQEDPLTK